MNESLPWWGGGRLGDRLPRTGTLACLGHFALGCYGVRWGWKPRAASGTTGTGWVLKGSLTS